MQIEEIWTAYRARLRSFLQSRVSNQADVEDLLQEISIKAFTGLPRLRDEEKVQSWLFSTAHHTIIDHYRKTGRRQAMHPDDLWYAKDDPTAQQELERCVIPFLDGLPVESGQLLRAVDIEGRSQKGLAEEAGVSYSTLKSRVQKARTDLRRVFEGCCNLTLDAQGRVADYEPRADACKKC